MTKLRFSQWAWLIGGAIVVAQLAAIGLLFAGPLPNNVRNLIPQVLVGGILGLLLLAFHGLRYHGDGLRPAPTYTGPAVLTVIAAVLTIMYFVRMAPFLRLPYDLGCWSESIFLLDIIKLRTGTPLYLPANDSNSNTYTFAAPLVSYYIARLFRHAASVPFYRLLLQGYLAIAAVFTASASWHLLRIVAPQKASKLSKLWLVFFVFASFLFLTNTNTASHSIYIHTEQLVLLVSAIAFWVMVKHAATHSSRWLWIMAVLPALGFLVKQYLAIWLVAYAVYLWFEDDAQRWRVVVVTGGSVLAIAVAIAACLLAWGSSFQYWVLTLLSTYIVSFNWVVDRIVDAGWFLVIAIAALLVLLRSENPRRLTSIAAAWTVLLLAGIYTLGAAQYTYYLGSATLVSWCWVLVAIAMLWPSEAAPSTALAYHWLRVCLGVVLVVTIFAGMGHPRKSAWALSPDVNRYAHDIEQEFAGLPPDRVLLDIGDWIYLRDDLVMKDRAVLLVDHRTPHYGLLDRTHDQQYAKILVHILPDGNYLYDIGRGRGIRRELLKDYREVRRIPGVRGMGIIWPYAGMTMGDVAVLEPIPRGSVVTTATAKPVPAPGVPPPSTPPAVAATAH